MKVLHTADWHLGKRLEQCERTDEHQHFLDWLIGTLDKEDIDVLIVAGDVFDTGSPSNTAFEQYYRFLRQVKNTCCREVIIIGGNHDSISTLNAPKELLKYFKVHIIGGVPENFEDQVIPIKNEAGEVALVVCAVPFLRDRDIRLSVPGEKTAERELRIRQGIQDHYNRFTEIVTPHKIAGIPVIATGHLFAAGSNTSESEKEIHVGNLGQVSGEQFPVEFDYVALGHIHRPQLVNKLTHIRYAGSPIPLSFSETADNKQVIILQFDNGKLSNLQELKVPACRKLVRLKGDLEMVKNKLLLLEDDQLQFPAWVELQIETESYLYELEESLNKLIEKRSFIERLFIRQIKKRPAQNLDEQITGDLVLNDLNPTEVFLRRYAAEYPDTDHSGILQTFEEALERMAQKESQ